MDKHHCGQQGGRFSGGHYGGFANEGVTGERSDERVKEQLCERLADHDGIDVSDVSVEVKDGDVTLTGTVNARKEKRAASSE
jgi:osmotically-inducible protein OsmY